jgi:5-dehydro-2-deoxygluconokinase
MLPSCDLVVGTEEEIHIAGGSSSTLEALRTLRGKTAAPIVMKRGPQGCVFFEGPIPTRVDDGHVVPGFPIDVLNVLGAGDAFLSGLLWGWLRGEGLEQAARYGNAAGAMVVTRLLCSPEMPREDELRAFMQASPRRADDDMQVRALHRRAGRHGEWPELCVLAFDHRSQLEDACRKANTGTERLGALKSLLAQAGRKAGAHGVLVDERYGAAALASVTGQGLWVGRPVEKPRTDPSWPALELEIGPDLGLALRKWPREHVVKCLAFPDPQTFASDTVLLERLALVQDAAHQTDHELLLELIPKRGAGPLEHSAIPRVMDGLYAKGIAPDWWKLPSMPRTLLWREIDEVIAKHDPGCRGVLVLGLDAPEAQLADAFKLTRDSASVKGFAVGRTLFGAPAAEWLAGRLDDGQLVERVAAAFERLMKAWRQR